MSKKKAIHIKYGFFLYFLGLTMEIHEMSRSVTFLILKYAYDVTFFVQVHLKDVGVLWQARQSYDRTGQ